MSITRSTAASRGRFETRTGRKLELRLLAAVSAVVLAGIGLLVMAQTQTWKEAPVRPLNLSSAISPAELERVLNLFEHPGDRKFAAQKIVAYLRNHHPESVGDLRVVRISLQDVARTPDLKSFAQRAGAFRERGSDYSFPLLTSAQMAQLRPFVSIRTSGHYYQLLIVHAALFFLAFFVLHAVWQTRRSAGDQCLLPIALFLSGSGFLMMIRLRDPLRDALLFGDFSIGVIIGCMVAFLTSLPDYERSPLRRLAYVPLLLSFGLSVILILFGSGPGLSDARINLKLGPIQFQPVELIKLLLIFFLAAFFADRWEFLRRLRQSPRTLPGPLRSIQLPMLRYSAPLLIAIAIAISFFFLEKDLGPALIVSVLFLFLYAVARSKPTGAVAACIALVAAVGIGYGLNVPRTVTDRLSMWLSPWDNFVLSGGDHLAQSLWSFSAGGLSGSGLGMGDPASVPAAHTDLVLAAIGEELGFVGLLCVGVAYVLLIHRAFRISVSSRGAYSVFLGTAAALVIALQVIFIAAGILGVLPLSGVVTPFLNYGKSSAVSNFALLGILASLSRDSMGNVGESFARQLRWVKRILAAAALVIFVQAARVQVFQGDFFLGRGALVTQADGHRRYTYSPRVLEAAQSIPRGTIYDRNGIPLASDSAELLRSYRAHYARMGVDLEDVLRRGGSRFYPFGALTFHLLGDARSRLNWGASNSSYVERELNSVLQGYDSRDVVARVKDRPNGPEHLALRRDLRELVPLVRYRYRPDKKAVRDILDRNRDVHISVDIRLQAKVAAIMDQRITASGTKHGAAVVLDPETGDLLASVSHPWRDVARAQEIIGRSETIPDNRQLIESLLDRARFGLYPPGSSFKLVTSIAAYASRPDAHEVRYECRRLPDGRVGNYVRGWGRPIRDDILDRHPHGSVDMERGLVLSCNAYFAQLGKFAVGAQRLLDAAARFGIRVAVPNTVKQLNDALPQASYGQGQVVASPLQMARVAAAIGNGGSILPVRIDLRSAVPAPDSCLTSQQAAILSRHLRRAVTEGTGTAAAGSSVPVAGKTGTAEVRNQPAHAWFVGFAPYGSLKKIAFAILMENARYGGRAAAPAAAEIADAAAALGLFRQSRSW